MSTLKSALKIHIILCSVQACGRVCIPAVLALNSAVEWLFLSLKSKEISKFGLAIFGRLYFTLFCPLNKITPNKQKQKKKIKESE